MKLLYEDLLTLTFDQKFIEKKALEEYLLRRKTNKETRVHLPGIIALCKEEGVRKMIENLDLNKNKLINLKLFINSMILIQSQVINERNIKEIKEKLGKTADFDKFVNVTELIYRKKRDFIFQ